MVSVDPITGTWVNVLDERRLARSINNRFLEMASYRYWHETMWRAVQELVLPEREAQVASYNNTFGFASGASQRSILRDLGSKVYDLTSPAIIMLLAGGIQGYYVGRQDNWFKLSLPHRELMELPGVRGWLYEVQVLLYQKLQEGTFHDQFGPMCLDDCSIGNGIQFVERSQQSGKYLHTTINPMNAYMDKNHEQQIDTVYRVLTMTRRQAIQKFGAERLSKRIATALSDTTQFKFLHAVFPRTDADPEMGLSQRQFGSVLESDAPYISVYKELPDLSAASDGYGFLHDARDYGSSGGDRGEKSPYDRVLHVGGHQEFPYLVWRWDVNDDNVYGIGPFQRLFTSVKQLNDYAKLMKQATLSFVRPPWIAPTSLRGQLKLYPDGVNLLSNPSDRLEPIQRQMQHYPFGVDRENRMAQQLREATGVDYFLLHSAEQKRELTATEVWEKQGEKAAILTSQMGRLGNDYLAPVIDYYYYQEKIRGNLPTPPESLWPYMDTDYGRFKMRYTGPLAQAQQRQAKLNWFRTIEQMAILGQIKPESLDTVDFDYLQRAFAEDNLPEEAVRTVLAVKKLRDARIEREQIMERLDQLESLAKSSRNMGGPEGLAAVQPPAA